MATVAVSSKTAADTAYTFNLAAGATAQIFCVPNLGPREYVQLERSITTGAADYNNEVRDADGESLLSEGKNNAIVTGPGYFRINKPVTDEATAIYIDL